MIRIVMMGFLSLLSVPGLALAYTQQDANEDAVFIWASGCTDFKSGMNAGDFSGWMRVGDAAKTFLGIKRIAAQRLYMDGWEVARGMRGVVDCQELAKIRAADYVSGVDIRRVD